jgi:hypothetical protein
MSIDRYKKNAPKGYCGDPGRGAAMGRADINPKAEPAGPLTMCYVELDEGGYDVCGTYWGHSYDHHLYFAYGNDEAGEDIELFLWSGSSAARARADVRARYPDIDIHFTPELPLIDFPEEDVEADVDDALVVAMEAVVDDDLAKQHTPEELPSALSTIFYAMCLRACDHGAGAHDLAEMLRDVARRLDSAEEDVKCCLDNDNEKEV